MAPPVNLNQVFPPVFNELHQRTDVICDRLVTVLDNCLLAQPNVETRHQLKEGFRAIIEDALSQHPEINEPDEEVLSNILQSASFSIDATRNEGRILRQIGEDYMNSRIRRRIRDVANQTDIKNLNYTTFCQIMTDLSGKDWLIMNEGLLVVLLAYFKDLIYRAFAERDIEKACYIIWYFVKYIKVKKMVLKLTYLISTCSTNKWLCVAGFVMAASTIVTGIYYVT